MKSKTKARTKRKKAELASAELAGVSGGRMVFDTSSLVTLGKAVLKAGYKAATRRGR